MHATALIPLMDLLMLLVGGLLLAQTEMTRVEVIDIDLTDQGGGAVAVRQGDFELLTVTEDGLRLGGRTTTLQELAESPPRATVVVRADRMLPTERLIQTLGALLNAGIDVALAVERPPSTPSAPD